MVDGRRRWDTDDRGRGVADGRALVPELDRLRQVMNLNDWVAEDPEKHLLPHVRRALDRPTAALVLTGYSIGDDGVLVIRLRPVSVHTRREMRQAAWELIAAVAEQSTFVRERSDRDATIFELATGALDGDGPFAPHGHTIRLVVDMAVAE